MLSSQNAAASRHPEWRQVEVLVEVLVLVLVQLVVKVIVEVEAELVVQVEDGI